MATREQVLSALYTRLTSKVTGLAYTARVYRDPTTLQPEEQPAMLVLAEQYDTQVESGRPRIWTIRVTVILYARADAEGPDTPTDATPETKLNALVDQVETALKREDLEPILDMSEPHDTNLNGLCKRCSVAGSIDLIPGEVGGQGAAMIPVEILLNK